MNSFHSDRVESEELLLILFYICLSVCCGLLRMAHSANEVLGLDEAGNSATSIEIKIKTMDSQTYTLQVDKQVIKFSIAPLLSY